jgi:cardiolipin synthase
MLYRDAHRARWLVNGDQAFAAMRQIIQAARQSVQLEFYMIRPQEPADSLRTAMLSALRRGVRVNILYDAFGSEGLPADFFCALRAQGAHIAVFSPTRKLRLAFRDHRKLLVCDQQVAILGGLNIGPEYAGDGVTRGWRDLALMIEGPVVASLSHGFDAMQALAPLTPASIRAFRRQVRAAPRPDDTIRALQSGFGWPRAQLRRALHRDLQRATTVRCMAAYFLPSSRIRRELAQCVGRGGSVQLLLAGRTDSEHIYARLLRRGVQLFEYQPQVLHAKLLIIDDVVYVGSCNLDRRSLHINYELMLRLEWPALAAQARELFDSDLERSTAVSLQDWRRARHWWERWRSAGAYWLLSRLDPLLARRRLRALS